MQDTLARKLRVLRAERGLTLREAEQLTGVDKDTLSKIERGLRHPYDVTLSKLARGYEVPVEDLLEERVPLSEAPESEPAPTPAPTQESLMSRTEVDEWLIEQGHKDRETFLSWVEECEDEDDVEQKVAELHETRDRILEELRKPEVHTWMFPRRSGLATKEERVREALRPAKLARRLANEIRREYAARELGLVNYSRVLFIEGKADDYLVYEHGRASHEHARERHERLLETRQAAARELEESYAKALAL
jgi:transcriptional regulator with XRE-family HTH domain